MNDTVLTLDTIEKGYNPGTPGEVRVLKGASLTVAPGEVVAMVAPSGAGKSTLLHIAGLLDTADSGRVEIDGADVTGYGDRRRTAIRRGQVGFIYQFHHLLPEFTALENIVLPQLANGASASEPETPSDGFAWPCGCCGTCQPPTRRTFRRGTTARRLLQGTCERAEAAFGG